MREKTMYPVIKSHLESLGFKVRAEVADVDIMAVKNKKSLLIEMKQSFSSHSFIRESNVRNSRIMSISPS